MWLFTELEASIIRRLQNKFIIRSLPNGIEPGSTSLTLRIPRQRFMVVRRPIQLDAPVYHILIDVS
jgi:hypothetical protein